MKNIKAVNVTCEVNKQYSMGILTIKD